MYRKLFIVLRAILMLLPLVLYSTPANAVDDVLKIIVRNVQSNSGYVYLKLFHVSEESSSISSFKRTSWLKNSDLVVLALREHSTKGYVTFNVKKASLTGGDGFYAVAVFQDLNANHNLDVNFVGYPKEPFGFSGTKYKKIPPAYDEASFYVSTTSLTKVSINLIGLK